MTTVALTIFGNQRDELDQPACECARRAPRAGRPRAGSRRAPLTDSRVADTASRATGARSASSSTTSPPCTRWRSSWRKRLPPGKPVEGVTWDVVHELNARHATENDAVTKEAALDLLRRNSAAAAAAIRATERRGAGSAPPRYRSTRRSAHLPVLARGPRRPTQLPPPGANPCGVEERRDSYT